VTVFDCVSLYSGRVFAGTRVISLHLCHHYLLPFQNIIWYCLAFSHQMLYTVPLFGVLSLVDGSVYRSVCPDTEYFLTQTNRVILEKLNGSHLVRVSPRCMEGSLPRLQEPAACPCCEPDQSSPCPPPSHFLKIHINIITQGKYRKVCRCVDCDLNPQLQCQSGRSVLTFDLAVAEV
jgi:hypothetical protein